MKTAIVIAMLFFCTGVSAQNRDSLYKSNTEIMVKFLDTVGRDLDSSVKILWLEGDFNADKRFEEFADRKGIFCVVVNKTFMDKTNGDVLLDKEVKSFEIHLNDGNPTLLSVNYGSIKQSFATFLLDMEGGFYYWEYDKHNRNFIFLPEKTIK